ncbi:hypothetical protein EBR43_05325 [bacterium]|nr:hypothetical protein [bacterium]
MITKEYYTGNIEPKVYPFNFENNECIRYTDKENNQSERLVISNYWREQINLYGQKVGYIVNNTTTLSADMLYGEQPTQRYSPPRNIIIAINLNENALMLSKFGLVSDDEVTAFVHISSFYEVFGTVQNPTPEPKAGDLFQLTEYGSDRPNGRDGNIYEITQRLDQDIAQINALAGHYVWLIKAKRFEYSFEPGLSGEAVNDQVFDDTTSPYASGAQKPYSYNVDNDSKKVFDYAQTDYGDVYGGYY